MQEGRLCDDELAMMVGIICNIVSIITAAFGLKAYGKPVHINCTRLLSALQLQGVTKDRLRDQKVTEMFQ